jgi:3-oxoacyl-(acyl-carrier-protein) synthase
MMAINSERGIFITDSYCISPQQTYNETFFEQPPVSYSGNRYTAKEPSYGNLIPAGLLRRMGKAVRMGVGAGLPLINRNPGLDGIILGTANGGLEDCIKFLNQIVDYEEGTLTPTNFVQSTPNAIGGGLALMSKNTGYSTTHVNKGLAFESALLDAFLLLDEGDAKTVLLGGVEEISEYNYNIDFLGGLFKEEEVTSATLLTSDTPGTVCGEGAAMFVVSSQKSQNALARILDVDQVTFPTEDQLSEKLHQMLNRNGLTPSEIDTVILGYSGDNRDDFWFTNIHESFFLESKIYAYKHLVGDYPTSSAFAMWLGTQLISGQNVFGQSSNENGKPKYILIYNHYKAVQHGFILLSAV